MGKAYNLLRTHYPDQSCARAIKSNSILPKHKIIASIALEHKLATLDKVSARGMIMINRCVLCKNAQETHDHLLLSCPFSQDIWLSLKRWMGLGNAVEDFHTEIDRIQHRRYAGSWQKRQAQCTFAATVYSIWMERNSRVFSTRQLEPAAIVQKIKFTVALRMLEKFKTKTPSDLVESLNAS
ncbi:uncharacterized protein LOC141651203 [Silene latifolia]|uniref:uncharacterized protein LOC141651203 n=1 Tax=Silene latifolia TaxID=37657 RepID=UPI003D78B259